MPSKRKTAAKPNRPLPENNKSCVCGGDCHSGDAYLPGYLFLLLGIVSLPINMGMIPGLEGALVWPVLFVVIAAVAFARVALCRRF